MSKSEIIKVDLTHFPTDERFIQIPGKLALADNLDSDDRKYTEDQPGDFPMQLDMNVCFMCTSGMIELEIDLKSYTLHSGDSAMLLSGSFCMVKKIAADSKVIFIAINPDFLKYMGNAKTIIEHVNRLKEQPVQTLCEEDLNENVMIYREIKKKLCTPDYSFKEEVAKSYLHIMLCNFFHHFANNAEDIADKQPQSRREELFVNFIKLVKDNYLTDRTISFYADKLCVSPKYLSSIVHQVSGKYATDWINQYVILEAKSMLRMESVAIKDVSNRLNFANQSFFAKFFKQHTGYTPKEYKAL